MYLTNKNNQPELIPFCTHRELLTQKGEFIKALGIITAEATQINYDGIKLIDGFDHNGEIEDINYVSYKKIDRVDINTDYISKKYNISQNTVRNLLSRLKELSDMYYDQEPLGLISIKDGKKGPSYWINHKVYNKYYTLIRRDILEQLLLLPANALKLYLVIKYNYDKCQMLNKPCIVDMKYLCRSIGLSENSRNRISPILFSMDNKFIKIKSQKSHHLIVNDKRKIVNAIKTEYTYEVL